MNDEKPQKPKRFLVFAYDMYYPGGGWNDLLGSTDTLEDARKLYLSVESRGSLGEIVDIETGEQHALTADGLVC